jgi:SAM-dependent methyltransferase
MTDSSYTYIGEELDLFAKATNWKSYLRRQIVPHLKGDVLEVGAGIGGTTRFMHTSDARSWTALEPDETLASRMKQSLASSPITGPEPRVVVGTTATLQGEFDTAIYIDVLEHIEHDARELETVASLLRPGGKVIVLSPAHQSLFTEFDRSIGHYRRYDRAMLAACTPATLSVERIRYLDCVGLCASLGNKLLLHSAMPSPSQIRVWDKLMVPISRLLDPLTFGRVGKSILGIWSRK